MAPGSRIARLTAHISAPSSAAAAQQEGVVAVDAELARLGFAPIASSVVTTALAELDEKGYTVVEGMIDERWLGQLRETFDALSAVEGRLGGLEVLPEARQQELLRSDAPGPNPGIRRLGDLVNKSPCFDGIWQNPLLITIVAGVLPGPFKVHSLNGHDPLAGQGRQALHADWGGFPASMGHIAGANKLAGERPPRLFGVVNSAWCLDDFSAEAGATRVVPRSHLRAGSSPAEDADREAVQVVAKAGSVVIWNGSTWHGGCLNAKGSRRRAVHCAWLDRQFDQQTNQQKYLREETAARLTPLHRYLLDVQ
jgi:hypothetical protein